MILRDRYDIPVSVPDIKEGYLRITDDPVGDLESELLRLPVSGIDIAGAELEQDGAGLRHRDIVHAVRVENQAGSMAQLEYMEMPVPFLLLNLKSQQTGI